MTNNRILPQLRPCRDCGEYPQFTHVGLVYRLFCACSGGSGPKDGERWKYDAAIWWNRYRGVKDHGQSLVSRGYDITTLNFTIDMKKES
jgi:hypothetical protein